MSACNARPFIDMAFHAELMDTQIDECPIHQSDEALTWCIKEGVRINTYGTVIRVTHRKSRKTVVRVAAEGVGGFSLPGHFMMACRDLWQKVNA